MRLLQNVPYTQNIVKFLRPEYFVLYIAVILQPPH